MDNHFHLLLKVPPMADSGLSDEVLLKRLSAICGEVFVAGIAKEPADARLGRLWEDRFKSVIAKDGVAAQTMVAYIDLNPVRAGNVKAPADYRWSSYGEAVGDGKKGNGKNAREGPVRAHFCDQGVAFDSERWEEVARL